jgi:hypothetical protein
MVKDLEQENVELKAVRPVHVRAYFELTVALRQRSESHQKEATELAAVRIGFSFNFVFVLSCARRSN